MVNFFATFVSLRETAFPKTKAPGMADMPGESQEEPSVMVIAIVATIR